MKRITIIVFLIIAAGCVRSHVQLKLGPSPVFVTYPDGQTEIQLQCVNPSDRLVFGVMAEVTLQHFETEAIVDVIRAWIGTVDPRGVKPFSVWTNKLVFGNNVGVRAVFEYEGVK